MQQDILAQSVSQVYPIGLRLAKDDRVFRYCQVGQALGGLARLAINANFAPGCTAHVNEDGFEGAIGFVALIGATYLDIADTAARAANFYQGGKLIVYGTTIFHQHHIVKSDAGDGAKVRVYLSEPLAVENITIAMGCTAYRSPYSDVKQAGSTNTGFETFVGLPLIPVTINWFAWLQTKGLCAVTPTGGTWPGGAVNLRSVYANPADGTLQPATISDPSAGFQKVGDLMTATVNAYGDLLIKLDLDPD